MRKRKLQLGLIILTFISLLALLAIQVRWIYNAAEVEEEHFSQRVEMALQKVVEKLGKQKPLCQVVDNCMGCDSTVSCYQDMYKKEEWAVVDSIINCALHSFHIDLNYDFDIVDISKDKDYMVCKKTYFSDNFDNSLLQKGVEIKVHFPKKSEFIIAQIGLLFISSILLIILVTVSFLIILKYYNREKALYNNTRDFINNMTHEFKTPITNIALANSMLYKNEKIKGDEKLTQYSGIIKTEQSKLKNRVEGLLNAARIENGSEGFCETIDVCNLIKCTVDSHEVQVHDLKGEINYIKGSDKCTVHIDKEQFQYVISNLIDNAIKYCERKPNIIVRSLTKGHNVIIEVEDNGIGIKREHQQQIFEKYYRIPTGDVHNVKGFGIGLSTVKAIIDSANGEIDVHSKPGKGSLFRIKLPHCNG